MDGLILLITSILFKKHVKYETMHFISFFVNADN